MSTTSSPAKSDCTDVDDSVFDFVAPKIISIEGTLGYIACNCSFVCLLACSFVCLLARLLVCLFDCLLAMPFGACCTISSSCSLLSTCLLSSYCILIYSHNANQSLGNIGSGKTTLLTHVREILQSKNLNQKIIFLKEPVDVWETIKDEEGKTMLEKFYADQEKYSFAFQMMVFAFLVVHYPYHSLEQRPS